MQRPMVATYKQPNVDIPDAARWQNTPKAKDLAEPQVQGAAILWHAMCVLCMVPLVILYGFQSCIQDTRHSCSNLSKPTDQLQPTHAAHEGPSRAVIWPPNSFKKASWCCTRGSSSRSSRHGTARGGPASGTNP
jgi:hypothetical protein